MPKQSKQDAREEESLLLRSAESLGRVIGALQRQLDGATRRLADTADIFDQERATPARRAASGNGRPSASRKSAAGPSKSKSATKRKATGSKKTASAKRPSARKTRG
jgi:hypothetical protein